MFKEFIITIVLHLLVVKENEAKEDEFVISKLYTRAATSFDDAMGNCAERPTRKADGFTFYPAVS
jgi:hypothetical protein